MKVKTLLICALTLWAITSRADDEQFPVLKANGQVYSNATVFKVTATDIFFVSDQGTANAKLKSLDPALRNHFLTGAPIVAADEQKSAATNAVIADQETDTAVDRQAQLEKQWKQALAVAGPKVIAIVGGICLFFYLCMCYCFKRICDNCGVAPGILIWIPVFNLIRLLQAGGLSGWLFVLYFVPFVNIVMPFVMWAKICQACGKSPWLVLMLLFPVVNLIFILYLAFSESSHEEVAPVRHSVESGKVSLR